MEDARRTKKDMLLFKVDFEKAFDSVDWCYLDAVMKKKEFSYLAEEVDHGMHWYDFSFYTCK